MTGISGAGKTTIANSIIKSYKHKFSWKHFISGIDELMMEL